MKIEKVAFIQANRTFDLTGPIKLAKFRVFICSKMEHKINKIRRNLYTSEKPRIRQLQKIRLFSEYDDHEPNHKPVSDMCFSTHFELGYLTFYNILLTVTWASSGSPSPSL